MATTTAQHTELLTAARAVLETNWTGSHTLPATGLYPHQWSWDSAFIAVGLRHVDVERAQLELESLLGAQWQDGRVPQIVYDTSRDDDYAPGSSFWGLPTAALVQPPNHAWAVWEVHRADPGTSQRREFLQRIYPQLVAWHEYLCTRRCHSGSGLARIIHPWESGTDNSPLWDEALSQVPVTPQHEILRPDLRHAAPSERPGAKEYGRYFWLAEHYRDRSFDDHDGQDRFAMEDPGFNALWALSEEALASIAGAIGADPAPHLARVEELTHALGGLYDTDLGLFIARDVVLDKPVRKATVNGLVPAVLQGLPQADDVIKTILGPRFLGSGTRMVPSYDVTAPDFLRSMYWRGPAWFNMNWLLIRALRTHGRDDVAATVAAEMVRLGPEHDFPEYVDPWTGAPHGTRWFSWTAALTLDLVRSGPRESDPTEG